MRIFIRCGIRQPAGSRLGGLGGPSRSADSGCKGSFFDQPAFRTTYVVDEAKGSAAEARSNSLCTSPSESMLASGRDESRPYIPGRQVVRKTGRGGESKNARKYPSTPRGECYNPTGINQARGGIDMKRTRKTAASAIWVVLLAGLLMAIGCDGGGESPTEADVAAEQAKKEAMEKKKEPEPLTGKHVVIMETTKGTVKMELDADAAPKTVENFLGYMDRRFYDGTIFHRVVKRFMVQGGGFTFDLKRKMARAPIENESDNGLKNVKGAVSMARGKDPQSATSQFFINLRNSKQLDHGDPKGDGAGYCVFGKVLEGMEAVEAIGKVKTGPVRSRKNVPIVPVFIKSIRRAPPVEAEMSETSE